MSEFAQYLLDLLGEIGGGRGDPTDDLARFALGLMFWLLLIGSAMTIRRVHVRRRNSLLLMGMGIAAGRELLMLVSHSLALYNVVPASSLDPFVPPLEHALLLVARIVIAAAFLFYLLDNRITARRFLQAGMGGAVAFYLVTAVLWPSVLAEDPQLQFSGFIGAWFAHGWGSVTMVTAIVLLARSSSIRRVVICIPFTFFFLDYLLSILNLATNEVFTTTLTPLSQSFHIFALPWFGYIYWLEQIDEQDRLFTKLIESERLEVVGQLAAGIAHDFNNHLQAIMGHAQMPVTNGVDLKTVSKRFDHITESVEKASGLVHRLLAFRADGISNELEVINLNEVVQSLAPMLTGLLSENQSLACVLDPKEANVRADSASVEQSIINLIVNARDAMPDGGGLQLKTELIRPATSARHKRLVVRLSVADTGCGMDENTLKRAFEPFFTTRGVGKGTGLGLASVYNHLHRLGGQASIDSRPGSGTTVRLDFPGVNAPDAQLDAQTEPPLTQVMPKRRDDPANVAALANSPVVVGATSSASEFLLLAEGNPAIRNTAAAQLRSAGYTVIAVANGEAAIQSMRGAAGNKIALLLLDIAMPRIGGYEAFDTIKQLHPNVPVVFLCDQTQTAATQRTSEVHLIKPFHRDQLLKKIQSTLEKSSIRKLPGL